MTPTLEATPSKGLCKTTPEIDAQTATERAHSESSLTIRGLSQYIRRCYTPEMVHCGFSGNLPVAPISEYSNLDVAS